MDFIFGIILLVAILWLANPMLTKVENFIANVGKKKKDK